MDGHDPRPIGGRRHGVGRVDDLGPDLPGERRQLGKQTPQVRGAAQPDGRVPAGAGAGRCQGDGLGTADGVEAVQQAADVGLVARLVACRACGRRSGRARLRRRGGAGERGSVMARVSHGNRGRAVSPRRRSPDAPGARLPAGRLRAAPTVPYHDTRSPGARGPPGRRATPRAERRAQAPASRRQPTDRKSRVRASRAPASHRQRGPGRRRGRQPQAHGARRPRSASSRPASTSSCRPAGASCARSRPSSARRWTRSAARRCCMPVLNPAEIWQESGRWEAIGDEMFRLKDRKGADMALAMTHEEVVTWLAAREIHSYKQLPQLWYHIQTKERDEARPKSGILRTREFIMKDSYSLDVDLEALQASYDKHIAAYDRIYERCGVDCMHGRRGPGHDGRRRRARVHGLRRGRRGRDRLLPTLRLRGQRRAGRRRSRPRAAALRDGAAQRRRSTCWPTRSSPRPRRAPSTRWAPSSSMPPRAFMKALVVVVEPSDAAGSR